MSSQLDTLQGLYDFFDAATALPEQGRHCLGRWLAWPAAKMYLYTELLGRILATGARDDALWAAPPPSRLARHQARLAAGMSVLRFLRLAAAAPVSDPPAIAWMVATFPSRGPDEIVRDSIFDELPERLAAFGRQVALVETGPHGCGVGPIQPSALALAAAPLAAALAPLMARRRRVAVAAAAIADALTRLAPGAPIDFAQSVRSALGAFEARRIVWRTVLRRLNPALLIVTDGGFRAGEIAAAKECGIPVVEFQHGLFGPQCPDYGWPRSYAAQQAAMPTADSLAVFGSIFRTAALARGFWRDDAVSVVGNGTIDRYLATSSTRHTPAPPLRRVLFLTQNLNRSEATAFWLAYLAGGERGDFPTIELTLKIHPAEADATEPYDRLAARYPAVCRVAAADASTHRLIAEHGLIVSFTSNGLVEAGAFGRPAVSLAAAQTPAGLLGLCPLPGLSAGIQTVRSPAEFATRLTGPAEPSAAAAASAELYAAGFLERATALVAGLLQRELRP
jgi:hypothetical protein